MERVVTINLNGNPYQLEEPAYDALGAYLTRAETALGDNPDKAAINAAALAYYEKRDDRDPKALVFRYLPYRAARWIDRWGILLAAIAASHLGLVKVLPALTRANFTLHLNRAYRVMAEVDRAAAGPGPDRAALLARLGEIDRASLGVPVPRASGAEYMDFRQCLHDLRGRVEGLPGGER